jgi:uncharacterized membrane protein YkvI
VRKEWRRALAIMNCYMGALIGAGFASGQELFQFFVRYGYQGLKGVLVAGVLFAGLGAYVLAYKYKTGLSSYGELLTNLLGKTLGRFADIWISSMLFAGLVIMLAGCEATLQQQFNIAGIPALIISSALILFTMAQGEKGVLQLNSVLIPLLVVITVLVAVLAMGNSSGKHLLPTENRFAFGSWFLAAILYVSYNMILGTVILSSLEVSNLKNLWGGFWGGLGLGLLAAAIVVGLLANYTQIAGQSVPMLFLAQDFGLLKYLYVFVLWFAMLTTAVANVFGLVKRMGSLLPAPSMLWALLLLMAASFLTPLGFTKLVATLYPFFGYIGLLLLGGLIRSILLNSYKYVKSYFKP